MKAYELQASMAMTSPTAFEIVRCSDGESIANDYGGATDLGPVADELNRLASENAKLREGRDAELAKARKEIERLKVQLQFALSEKEGQLALPKSC